MKFILRNANLSDLDSLSRSYVKCYYEAYSGLLPAPVIMETSLAKASKKWRTEFTDQTTDSDKAILVIENESGDIVGFSSCGASKIRSVKALGQGEIYALNVEAEHQGYGLGKALMLASARWLISRGLFSGGMWTLEENGLARRFLEDLGARVVSRKRQNMRGFQINYLGMAWSDLSEVAQLEVSVPDWGAFGR